MEIKLKRKGEIITVGMPEYAVPAVLMPTEGLEGIDLTGYSVIYATFGRKGHEKAENLHKKAPKVVLVYHYEWYNGWGEGVLLPEGFNPSRVRFYKTASQVEAEQEKARKREAEALRKEVEEAIPDMIVSLGHNYEGVEIKPHQEVFALNGWGARADTLEEAKEKVAQRRPTWEEWNRIGIEAYLRHSDRGENPGKGNIQISPAPFDSSITRVGVCYNHNRFRWIILERNPDGGWEETIKSHGPPSRF